MNDKENSGKPKEVKKPIGYIDNKRRVFVLYPKKVPESKNKNPQYPDN